MIFYDRSTNKLYLKWQMVSFQHHVWRSGIVISSFYWKLWWWLFLWFGFDARFIRKTWAKVFFWQNFDFARKIWNFSNWLSSLYRISWRWCFLRDLGQWGYKLNWNMILRGLIFPTWIGICLYRILFMGCNAGVYSFFNFIYWLEMHIAPLIGKEI